MKASELIEALQKLVAEHGDHEVWSVWTASEEDYFDPVTPPKFLANELGFRGKNVFFISC